MPEPVRHELLPDHGDRSSNATAHDTNLVVEAGAGSGKTSSLVRRIVALVASGVEIGAIAAIKYTERAAAELRPRLRTERRRAEAGAGSGAPVRGLRRRAAVGALAPAPSGSRPGSEGA